MSFVLTAVMAIAAALFVALSATVNALFLSSLGRTPWEVTILAALSITSDLTKAVLPVVIIRALVVRAWIHLAGATAMLLFVGALSLSSGIGFTALTRDAATAARQAHADDLAAQLRALADIEARIAQLPPGRPVSVIDALIDERSIDRRWLVSKSCSSIAGSAIRAFCADLFALKSDRTAAVERERLSDERISITAGIAKARDGLDGATSDPQATAMANLLGVDTATPRRVLTVFMAVVIELGSVILILLVSGPALLGWREPGSQSAPEPQPVSLPQSSDVNRWHRRRNSFSLGISGSPSDAR